MKRFAMTAVAEILVADLFWGFSFIAASWAVPVIGASTLCALRFSLASFTTLCVALFYPPLRGYWRREDLKLSIVPGLFMVLSLLTQGWGLLYTTPGRSAFITCLYVVFVPLVERFGLREPLERYHLLLVATALVGTALMVDLTGAGVNRGDVLTLFSAILATGQIVWLGENGSRIQAPMLFNSMQCFWAALVAGAFALFYDLVPVLPHPPSHITLAWLGVAILTWGCTWLATGLQVRAQKQLTSSLASLLFLLEAPLALAFSLLFLLERPKPLQWVGAALILLASVLAVLFERPSPIDQEVVH